MEKPELLNRFFGEPVRAMLYHANMPLAATFWAEAMSAAAFILNYLPSETIGDRLPWKCSMKDKPRLTFSGNCIHLGRL